MVTWNAGKVKCLRNWPLAKRARVDYVSYLKCPFSSRFLPVPITCFMNQLLQFRLSGPHEFAVVHEAASHWQALAQIQGFGG